MSERHKVITIESTESGQRRRYGDSYFGALITFAFSDGSAWTATEKQARQVAATALRYGAATAQSESTKENWAQGYFESVRADGPGKWRVLIVEPYTD